MPRPAGVPNKRKAALLKRLEQDFPDYHPVAELAKIANDKENDVATRLQANKEVAKYVEPQLKAVEHSGTQAVRILTIAEQIQAAENASNGES